MVDRIPNQILDELHQLNISYLANPTLTAKDRVNEIKLAKQKLRLIRKRWKQETEVINKRWDGRNRFEASQEQRELAPYEPLEEVMDKIELFLSELEIRGEGVSPPHFGTILVEDDTENKWYLFTENEAFLWAAKRNRDAAKYLKAVMNQSEETIEQAEKKLHSKWKLYFGVALIFAGVILAVFIISLFGKGTESSLLMALGLVCVVPLAGVYYIWSWSDDKRKIRVLIAEIRQQQGVVREQMKVLKENHQEIQKNLSEL